MSTINFIKEMKCNIFARLVISIIVLSSYSFAKASIYNGKCGENIYWTLDTSTGVLDIEGSGRMYDYKVGSSSGDTTSPWSSYRYYIKTINISEGITHIGNFAFYYIDVENITLTDYLMSIGKYAFYLSDLKEVIIPDNVKEIGESAFACTNDFEKIQIGKSVTSIGRYGLGVYFGRAKLIISKMEKPCPLYYTDPREVENTKLIVPKGCAKSYENTEYWSCFTNISEEDFSDECDDACDFKVDGIYYDFVSLSDLTCKIVGYDLNRFLGIGNTVLNIGESIEYNGKKMRVVEIKSEAFSRFPGLSELSIPSSVQTIGTDAFYKCASLKSVTIPLYIPKNNTSFADLPVENVHFIGDGTSIPNWFAGCTHLKNVQIDSNNVTEVSEGAFKNCSSLEQFTISKSIVSIANDAFSGCTSMKTLVLDESAVPLTIGYSAERKSMFGSCPLDSLFIGRNLVFEVQPFKSNTKITYLKFGDSVTAFGDESLALLSELNTLIIGSGIKVFPEFKNAKKLQEIIIGSGVKSLPSFAVSAILRKITLKSYRPQDIDGAFTNSVYINCEVKIPNNTRRDYQSHTVWGNFWSLSEYATSTKASTIKLEESIVAINDTSYIDYVITPYEANNNITVQSSNPDVLEIIDNKYFFGKKEGTSSVTIKTVDGTKLSSTQTIHVIPIVCNSISLNFSNYILRQDSIIKFSTTVLPSNTTNKKVTWKSDDETIATVSQDGLVKGVQPGETLIIASTTDGSNISDTCRVVVKVPYDLGDVNDDGRINVGDISGTVNFIMDENIENLIFEAADINSDGIILVDDLSNVIQMAMDATITTSNSLKTLSRSKMVGTGASMTLNSQMGECSSICVSFEGLDDDKCYTGVQFDISIPSNVCVDNIEWIGKNEVQLLFKETIEQNIRVIAYSPSNASSFVNEEVCMNITMHQMRDYHIHDEICFENIALATSHSATQYLPTVSHSIPEETTDVCSVKDVNRKATVYNTSGQVMTLSRGIVIVNGKKIFLAK